MCILAVSTIAVYEPFASAYTETPASAEIETVVLESPELPTDQVAFTARLSDENRRVFIKLKNEQREAVIVAAKNGLTPDEAVEHMVCSMKVETCTELEPSK